MRQGVAQITRMPVEEALAVLRFVRRPGLQFPGTVELPPRPVPGVHRTARLDLPAEPDPHRFLFAALRPVGGKNHVELVTALLPSGGAFFLPIVRFPNRPRDRPAPEAPHSTTLKIHNRFPGGVVPCRQHVASAPLRLPDRPMDRLGLWTEFRCSRHARWIADHRTIRETILEKAVAILAVRWKRSTGRSPSLCRASMSWKQSTAPSWLSDQSSVPLLPTAAVETLPVIDSCPAERHTDNGVLHPSGARLDPSGGAAYRLLHCGGYSVTTSFAYASPSRRRTHRCLQVSRRTRMLFKLPTAGVRRSDPPK